ncbi:MAG: holo-ACP synthase [Defluviitaleaceae bacterium]|nr:holo-ACP synthase [Defluviitaleaceae bacterium]
MKHAIFGVGVDIVKVERFEKYVADPSCAFMQKIFTSREREYLSGKKAQSIAGIFAAKEAVAKALGTGFAGRLPRDIEILHKQSGMPYVVLHKKKSRRRYKIHVSISHTDTDAIAYATIGNHQF